MFSVALLLGTAPDAIDHRRRRSAGSRGGTVRRPLVHRRRRRCPAASPRCDRRRADGARQPAASATDRNLREIKMFSTHKNPEHTGRKFAVAYLHRRATPRRRSPPRRPATCDCCACLRRGGGCQKRISPRTNWVYETRRRVVVVVTVPLFVRFAYTSVVIEVVGAGISVCAIRGSSGAGWVSEYKQCATN